MKNPLSLVYLYLRAFKAFRYAAKSDCIGIEFARFGRRIGSRLLMKRCRFGLSYLLTPVNIVRYFEFPFALSCLQKLPKHCLDVSSPRLFSLYVAQKFPSSTIDIINPDQQDIARTGTIVQKLNMQNIYVNCAAVDVLPNLDKKYDYIWSISVVEHIAGAYDDSEAVKFMYDALNDGGRLILTIPVDRKFWNEYREQASYGRISEQSTDGKYFFERFYDQAAIWKRLLAPIGEDPSVIRWFGEIFPGRFQEYVKRWIHDGPYCTVDDPREIVDFYRKFSTYEEMPGIGICGLMIEKHIRRE